MKKLLMGNAAFACAALQSGVRVVAGYPGTPSSEVVETVAARHADGSATGVHVEWSTNEKAALELLAGASYCGARTLFTCKQMGMNVAADPLLSVNYVGVKGGMVLFVADDPGPISSQTEQDTRRFAAFAKVPVFDPATPEQGANMIATAFEVSERFNTPVIVRPTTRVCHASTYFDIAETTSARPVPAEGFARDPKWIIFPKRSYQAHGEIIERLEAIAVEASQTCETGVAAEPDAFAAVRPLADFNPVEQHGEDPELGIVAGGISAAYVREALAMLQQRAQAFGVELPAYRFMQVGTPFPFPKEAAARFADGLGMLLVFEELDHVLEDELLKLAGETHADYDVLGKLTGHARNRGENDVDDILVRLACYFDAYAPSGLGPVFGQLAGAPSEIDIAANCSDAGLSRKAAANGATETIADDARVAAATNCSDEGSPRRSADGDRDRLAAAANGSSEDVDSAGEEDQPPFTFPYEFAPESGASLPIRPPVLCAGCPHRGSFYAVKKALGKREAVYCGDIGCYTLGNAAPLHTTDTCLCMGAGITMAQGFSVCEPQKKQVAFVGDSTFFASAMTGIANAVYNGHDITIAVLDNATTAMTGKQPHPGTGVTLMGPRRKPIRIAAVLEALGVECIVRANPLDYAQALEAAQEAIDFEGPSAILFESPCVQLIRPGTPLQVDAQACTGCKKCITEIGCPAIGFDGTAMGPKSKGRGQAFVDATLCNGCGLCSAVCPFGCIGKDAAGNGSEGGAPC